MRVVNRKIRGVKSNILNEYVNTSKGDLKRKNLKTLYYYFFNYERFDEGKAYKKYGSNLRG